MYRICSLSSECVPRQKQNVRFDQLVCVDGTKWVRSDVEIDTRRRDVTNCDHLMSTLACQSITLDLENATFYIQ